MFFSEKKKIKMKASILKGFGDIDNLVIGEVQKLDIKSDPASVV